MAARTGGTVNANIMDRLESTSVIDIGGAGTGAAITQFSIFGWFISREHAAIGNNLCLVAFRSGEASTPARFYVSIDEDGDERRVRPVIADSTDPNPNHYQRSTAFEADGETEVLPPLMTVDKLWWVAIVVDASGGVAAPETIDIWTYSPSVALGGEASALRKVTMGHLINESSDFERLNLNLCLGGWAGEVAIAANQSKAHLCEYQDWGFMPSLMTGAQAASLANGSAAASVLAAIANRRVWSMREASGTRFEAFNSGINLSVVGTVDSVSNFAGVTVMPFSLTAVQDCYFASNDTTFPTAATIRVGYNTATNLKTRTVLIATNLVDDHGCVVGGTINSAILNLQCTTGAAAARQFQVRRMFRDWIEDTGSAGGVTWAAWDAYATPPAGDWTTPGATGSGDSTLTAATLALALPTTTGAKTYDITATIQACLDAGGDVRLLLIDDNDDVDDGSEGTTGVAQWSSREGATPWTIDVTYTAPTGGGGGSNMRGRGRYRTRKAMTYGG